MACPTSRMLALGVVASTLQLVRAMQNGQGLADVRGLVDARRNLLLELARNVNTPAEVGSLAALEAAVNESDRTLEALAV
jgi:hypothetical protein